MKRLFFLFVLPLSIFNSVVFAQTTITLTPNHDAQIGFHDGFPESADTNYGSADHIATQCKESAAGPDVGINYSRGLFDFDLSSIPPGATILSAYLTLYARGSTGFYPGHYFAEGSNASYLRRVTSIWNENTVTWNTSPTIDDLYDVLLPISTDVLEDYVDIDITALATDMYENPSNYGISLDLEDMEPTRAMYFCSTDYPDESKWPILVITYDFDVDCSTAIPADLYADGITATSATLHWDAVPGVDQYTVAFYNYSAGGEIKKRHLNDNFLSIPGSLSPSTTYAFRAKTTCYDEAERSSYSEWYYFTTSPGREDNSDNSFTFYPNPCYGDFTISLTEWVNTEIKISIIDQLGQIVYNKKIVPSAEILPIKLSEKPGIYCIKIESDQKADTQRIIIL